MFAWYVKNERKEVIASGKTNNYSVACEECGKYMQKNPNTSEIKTGYTCEIYEGNNRVR